MKSLEISTESADDVFSFRDGKMLRIRFLASGPAPEPKRPKEPSPDLAPASALVVATPEKRWETTVFNVRR